MSATMAGLEPMADWLGARLFLTNFRRAYVMLVSP
jgi:replicative superfamily II helicase